MSIPYLYRVGALILLAIGMILRDRRKGNTDRQWEYGCLFVTGVIGALYGAVNDAITVRLAPEYFAIGKGLGFGASLTSDAVQLGAKAGFSASVIACAIWQFALRHTPAPRRCCLIIRAAWLPFAAAAVCAIAAPVFLGHVDPLGFLQQLDGMIPPSRIAAFVTVWWTHMGTYAGLSIGLVTAIFLTAKP